MAGDLQAGDPERVGPYRLLGRLGAGGMGQVYLGRSAGGRLVAIKVIRPELASDSGFRARFTQEIAAARRVSGLFTAVVVDADVAGPVPWLATGYVAGPSLAEAVETQGPLPADSVLTLAAGLAEGLEAIHATGMVHRDLKPSNVLLAGDGPRVIDFGISRAAEATALTQTGMIIGSPGFMSPEQAEGGAVGQASDVFSLGAVIAFAATGAGPFGAGSTPALMYRVVHHQPDTSRLPGQIRPLIERCLAKDPRERPTPAALLAELGAGQLAEDWLPGPLTQAIGQYVPPGLTGPAGSAGSYGRTTGTGVPGPPGRAVTEAAGGHVPSPALPAAPAGPPTAAAFYPGPTGQAGPAGPPTVAAFPTGPTVPGGPPTEAAAPTGPTIPGGPPTEAAFLPQPGAPEGRPPRRKRRGLVWVLLAAGLAVAGAAAILVPRAITASPASQSQHTTGTRSAPTLSGGPQTEGTAARSATPSAVQQPSPVTGPHSTGPAARSSATPRSSATTASATPTTSSSPPSASPTPSSLAPSSAAPSTPPPTTPASGAPTQAAPSSG